MTATFIWSRLILHRPRLSTGLHVMRKREREITCALHQPRLKLLGFLSYTFEGNAETSHQCDTQCHRHIRPYIAASRFLTFCAAANGSFHRQLAKPAVKAAFRIQTDLVKMQVP